MSGISVYDIHAELLLQRVQEQQQQAREKHLHETFDLLQQEEREKVIQREGHKDDSGKLPYHLLAPEFLREVARVLEFGARKYSERNWEKGMAWHRPFGACMRHLWAWWGGEAVDPETGFSHLAHAACCLMFLVAYECRRAGTDDRPWGVQ